MPFSPSPEKSAPLSSVKDRKGEVSQFFSENLAVITLLACGTCEIIVL
jgi:hypothetical protein